MSESRGSDPTKEALVHECQTCKSSGIKDSKADVQIDGIWYCESHKPTG